MKQSDSPPEMEFFESARPPQGERTFHLQIADLALQLGGLGHELCDRLEERFARFSGRGGGRSPDLRVELGVEDTDYFITPARQGELNRVLLDLDDGIVRYLGYRVAGWFDSAGGRGQILLAGGDYEREDHAIENYVRAAVAWLAATRGGALVHAASAVKDGRGFLFYGESGAGKSTLSACNRRGRILSDDLSLVLPDPDGRPQVVGSPFRGTYEGGDVVCGRFPLAAGFRIVKDREVAVRRVPRVRALAELVGNLPFVAEAFPRRPDLFEQVERTFAGCPLAHLHFRKDDTFWDAIEREGL